MPRDRELMRAASACFTDAIGGATSAAQVSDNEDSTPIAGINLEVYRPVEPQNHYGELTVSSTGLCHSRPPLSETISNFISDLFKDLTLWDGTLGEFGREHTTNRPEASTVTGEKAECLRAQYIELKESNTPRTVLDKLRKELEKQNRTQNQLQKSVLEMQHKIDKLRKMRDSCEIGTGQSDEVHDLEDRLAYYIDELEPLNQAYLQIVRKVTQTEMELCDRETGRLRRVALLRRIFGEEPLRGGLLTGYAENAEQKAAAVNAADEASMKASRLLFQIKCFYIDAQSGKSHLYKVESALKTILDHLRDAMNGLSGHHKGSTPMRSPERSNEFRLRYVRRLWNALDADFKVALPYIQDTSLKLVSKTFRSKAYSKDEGMAPTLMKQFSFSSPGGRNHSIFNPSSNTVLPSFTKIELSHPLSKQAKVTALYRCAALSYREINSVYDYQEDIVQQALVELQKRAEDNRNAIETLLSLWEGLLGI